MAETIQVDGLDKLSTALKELPKNIARNVLRGAVAAGAADVRNEARNKAPVYTGKVSEGHPPPGTLKRSIYQKQIRELSDEKKQVFYVGVRSGKKYRNQGKKGNLSQDAFYWWMVENGTSKMPAHPFLRPAFEQKKLSAIESMANYIMKRLPDEVAKLR